MTENNNKNIAELWTEIKGWFEYNDKHGVYLNDFKSRASDEEINNVENKLKMTFPVDFAESYKTHNGVGYGVIVNGGEFLSLSAIESTWLNLHNVMEDYGYSIINSKSYLDDLLNDEFSLEYDARIKPFPFWPKWIPFMDQDGHTTWYIDLDPNEGGKVGQVIKVIDFEEWIVVADSFTQFLAGYQQELSEGKYSIDSLGNLTESSTLEKSEKEIASNQEIAKNISSNIQFDEIDKLSEGDLFSITGIITCEDHFINGIEIYRKSLKKSAFIERAKLKYKEFSAPKLSINECFILVGNNHLIVKKPLNNELTELSIEKVIKADIKVLENSMYQLLVYEILK